MNDLVKTSTGRKVSLSRLDQVFFGLPHTEQVITLAENLPFVCVIVAGAKNLTEKQKNEVETQVQAKNQTLSSYEQVRAVIFVNEMFTIDNQLVTNNLKLRRNKISERFEQQIALAVQAA